MFRFLETIYLYVFIYRYRHSSDIDTDMEFVSLCSTSQLRGVIFTSMGYLTCLRGIFGCHNL